METEALNWLSPIAKSPMGYLTIAITIVLGYLLRAWPKFPNEIIPHSCVVLGGLVFSVLGDRALVPDTVPLGAGRTVALICYGAVLGFVAFLLHHLVIRKIEDKLKGPVVPLLLITPLLFTGCATDGFAKVVEAIHNDPATTELNIQSPWGVNIQYKRLTPFTPPPSEF